MDRELYNAARSGDVSFLSSKEEMKIRNLVSQLTPTGSCVLHLAAESNQLEFFQEAARLCSPSLVKHANSKGNTPLHFAVRGSSTEVVEFIIKQAKEIFSDIEQGDDDHVEEGYKEVLRMENLDGDNALHLAARHNMDQSDVVRLLIQADSHLSTVVNSKSHQSACFIALAKRNAQLAHVLLSSSNPPCSLLGEINGMTALHLVAEGFSYTFDLVCKVLEAAPPDMIKQCDDIGWTPLHYAASYNHRELVKLFLKNDKSAAYKLDLQDGRSALHIAASLGRVDSMQALIEARPDCADLVDNRGRNALHAAVLGSQEDAITFMLSLPGTLFSEADQDGNTPLRLAILQKDERIMRAFAEKLSNFFLDKELRSVSHDVQSRRQQKAAKLVNSDLIMDANTNYDPSSIKDIDDYGYYQFSATLIATVTFTAAFTLPGGFIQSGAPKNEGMAVLTSKAAFQAFIIFDVLAFFASLSIVILLIFYRGADTTIRKALNIYLSISYYGMALAFSCGLYVVLGNSIGFSIVVLLLSVIGTLVAIFGSVTIGLRRIFYAAVRTLNVLVDLI